MSGSGAHRRGNAKRRIALTITNAVEKTFIIWLVSGASANRLLADPSFLFFAANGGQLYPKLYKVPDLTGEPRLWWWEQTAGQ